MTAIRVAHAGADYEVLVGDLAEALPKLEAVAKGRRLPLISDETIFKLYGGRLADFALAEPVLLPRGEAAKDWATLAKIVARLAKTGIRRGTPVIALGGGSIGDVAGLAASLFKRGCPIIHVPTTLLAQADSAIGGKTAIDAEGQKNLVGTFHHPLLVIAEPAFLDTLDTRQMRSGYAEVIKYGLIEDPGFFHWCEANGGRLLDGDGDSRRTAIEHCVRTKARLVAADPNDTDGTRALLNFGHTFGHAIEAVAGHALLHGEAVAIGMALAFEFSSELGLCPQADVEKVKRHFFAVGLPCAIGDIGLGADSIFAAMQSDKKSTATVLRLILTRGIGKAFVAGGFDLALLSDFLRRQP